MLGPRDNGQHLDLRGVSQRGEGGRHRCRPGRPSGAATPSRAAGYGIDRQACERLLRATQRLRTHVTGRPSHRERARREEHRMSRGGSCLRTGEAASSANVADRPNRVTSPTVQRRRPSVRGDDSPLVCGTPALPQGRVLLVVGSHVSRAAKSRDGNAPPGVQEDSEQRSARLHCVESPRNKCMVAREFPHIRTRLHDPSPAIASPSSAPSPRPPARAYAKD